MTGALFRPDLVASDLDGTLIAPDLTHAPDLPGAIEALRVAGIRFLVCTGRMLRSARPVVARLGIRDGLIVCYQGAMVADLATGEILLHRPMDGGAAAAAVRHLRDVRLHVNAYIDDRLYVEEVSEHARRYAEYAEVGMEQVDDLAAEVAARPPTKLVVISEPAVVDEALPRLQDHWRGRLYVVRSQPSYVEVADLSVSKSAALDWLCARDGARRERTVTCGDGPNDVDMLRWAGLGVAMAEAPAEVLGEADLVVARDRLPGLFRRLAAET